MSEQSQSNVKVFNDMGFTVVATPDSHHVDYKVYEVSGWESANVGDDPTIPLYGDEFQTTLDGIDVFLHGSVKWDGCSNWWFDSQDKGHMLHGCSKDDLLHVGGIMAACWDWTKELCVNWND